MDWASLGIFAFLALAGSLHCAGMCGGFAALVATRSDTPHRAPTRLVAYVFGKATTYSILGLTVGVLATSLERGLNAEQSRAWAHQYQSVLATIAGLTLIFSGLGFLGIASKWNVHRWIRPLNQLMSSARRLPGLWSPFAVGIVTGLLPCGLSWSALAVALVSGPLVGLVGMFTFGLATGPVLFAVGWLGARVSLQANRWAQPVISVVLIVFGGLTLLRGRLPEELVGLQEHALPECCSNASHAAGETTEPLDSEPSH